MPAHAVPLEVRFWRKVEKADGCWNWMGAKTSAGYGAIIADSSSRRMISAHRAVLELVGRAVPAEMQVDHLCFNKGCVNPEHLEVVTPQVNTRRANRHYGVGVAKTHCPQGHAYDAANTYRHPTGRRCCRACARIRARKGTP